MRNNIDNENTNLNCDCNTRQFIKNILAKKWFFHEIYIENFRMPSNYLVKSFSVRFIDNLVQMSKDGLLQYFGTKPGRIIFPFCAHFFHILNAKQAISDNFSLTYLSKDNINRDTHKLAFSTNLHKDEIAQTEFL